MSRLQKIENFEISISRRTLEWPALLPPKVVPDCLCCNTLPQYTYPLVKVYHGNIIILFSTIELLLTQSLVE